MYKWHAKTNAGWLEARRQCLTATDIKDILPSVRKYNRKTKEYDLNLDALEDVAAGRLDDKWLGLYARKVSCAPVDVESWGVMARGHELEPYAVAQCNADYEFDFNHWDDCLIVDKARMIGYSPDAMSMTQPDNCPVEIDVDSDTAPYTILEIKCYGEEHHMKCCYTEDAKQDERWQIATAMCVDNAVECGYVYYFNPNMPRYGHIAAYTRENLALEISVIDHIAKAYVQMREKMDVLPESGNVLLKSEDEIIADIVERENVERGKLENLVGECEV